MRTIWSAYRVKICYVPNTMDGQKCHEERSNVKESRHIAMLNSPKPRKIVLKRKAS